MEEEVVEQGAGAFVDGKDVLEIKDEALGDGGGSREFADDEFGSGEDEVALELVDDDAPAGAHGLIFNDADVLELAELSDALDAFTE